MLCDLDADIVTASSSKQDFCVILMGVKMAGLDGFETARLVRARPRSRTTPIAFPTSHRASDLDCSRGFEVGASDHVFTPVAPEVLEAKVQAFIDDAHERSTVTASAPRSRCCSWTWTWTTSRKSTTPLDTRLATACCRW